MVTGATSGIGEQFALMLAARGCSLVLLARRHDAPEALAVRLRIEYGAVVTTLPVDLSVPGQACEPWREVGRSPLWGCATD